MAGTPWSCGKEVNSNDLQTKQDVFSLVVAPCRLRWQEKSREPKQQGQSRLVQFAMLAGADCSNLSRAGIAGAPPIEFIMLLTTTNDWAQHTRWHGFTCTRHNLLMFPVLHVPALRSQYRNVICWSRNQTSKETVATETAARNDSLLVLRQLLSGHVAVLPGFHRCTRRCCCRAAVCSHQLQREQGCCASCFLQCLWCVFGRVAREPTVITWTVREPRTKSTR